MSASDLPTLNAILNAIAAIFLITGRRYILQGNRERHRLMMMLAMLCSALFLISYVTYHWLAGSVPYPHHDWTRIVYFALLIPHVILAAVMVPFILAVFWLALTDRFEKHRRLARWVWPVWIFVSFSGLAVYLMLYQL